MNSESLFNYLLKDLLHYIESRNKWISIIYIILSDLIFSSIDHKKTSFTFEIFLLNFIKYFIKFNLSTGRKHEHNIFHTRNKCIKQFSKPRIMYVYDRKITDQITEFNWKKPVWFTSICNYRIFLFIWSEYEIHKYLFFSIDKALDEVRLKSYT